MMRLKKGDKLYVMFGSCSGQVVEFSHWCREDVIYDTYMRTFHIASIIPFDIYINFLSEMITKKYCT